MTLVQKLGSHSASPDRGKRIFVIGEHILFVDDEVPIRETLSLFFKMKGIAVTAVGTGEEAMSRADTTQFSVAIFDIRLEGENGLDLLRRFKEKQPDTPVVIFTALGGDIEKRNEAMARGASGFFCKGDSLQDLYNGVVRVMRSRPVSAA